MGKQQTCKLPIKEQNSQIRWNDKRLFSAFYLTIQQEPNKILLNKQPSNKQQPKWQPKHQKLTYGDNKRQEMQIAEEKKIETIEA